MKKLLLVAVVAFAFVLSGCSAHLYSSSNASVAKTEVVLSQKNFKVIGQAEGVATITQVLGIGGCSQKQVRSNAVGEMFKNANLTGSQTIININVKQAVSGVLPFYYRTTYSATGTIIEFTE
jgi:uncharacterized protein YbjQ (UPF0145 family)